MLQTRPISPPPVHLDVAVTTSDDACSDEQSICVPLSPVYSSSTLPTRKLRVTKPRAKKTSSSITTKRLSEPKRKRIPTHVVRRQEKDNLLQEIEDLQQQLQSLKYETMVAKYHQAHTLAITATSSRTDPINKGSLVDAIQQQQLVLASLQGMLSGYVQQNFRTVGAIYSPIHLGKDRQRRRAAIAAMRNDRLRTAEQFIIQRCCSIDQTQAYIEEERFDTPQRDFCVVHFNVAPMRGFHSVRAAFDTLLYRLFNVEIILSERSGNITIREDDDSIWDNSMAHYRLLTNNASGVLTESNGVSFAGFNEATAERDAFGVITVDFVDDDELYPYRPTERVRKDVSMAFMVSSYIEQLDVQGEEPSSQLVVVFKRWSLVKLHHPKVPISMVAWQELCDEVVRTNGEMIKSIQQDHCQ